ncbi:kinesin-like protein KIF26B isoform X1 [Coregonus clupeaformis]|uniref:kinesin-like protein KIF26B isoform X1 n=1 Tax=Coregonus clupeaformis TaxID=59861 RepID=UPI001BDFEEC4|nr:kinesin-like protein KIF26B isoform X1 [Coregonus clupeaformis]
MTSLSGTKERSVTSRIRKYGMTDTSPTKSASFSPETWYRKAYEESRTGSRPAPEGAGSMPSSTGTPSPGSGTSSPGSFSGSPGTISPGIGTGSPGSLGDSPGFGTGSPGSGSGSSPGSERERRIWCENCNARLAELKRQALKLLIPGPYSSKDPSFSLLLHDKLQVPNSSGRAWNERDSRCDVCSTHLTQLKQEAVHMVLTMDQWDLSPSSPPTLPSRGGPPQGPTAPWDWAYLPSAAAAYPHPCPNPHHPTVPPTSSTASFSSLSHAASNPSPGAASVRQTSTHAASSAPAPASSSPVPSPVHQGGYSRQGSKPSSLGVGLGVERRNGSPAHSSKATGVQSAQPPHSPGNNGNSSSSGAVLSTAALQAHQYMSRTNGGGVTLYPYQISQMISDGCREGLTEAVLNRYNADRPAPSSSQAPPTLQVTTAAPTTTSAAASFFARAAQKLNLSSKKKKQRPVPPPVVCDPPLFPTNFSGTLQTAPPPAPPCLLRAASKIKDTPGLGKVKVMVRVCPVMSSDAAESSSFLKVDTRKKQVTIMDPSANQTQGNTPQKRGGANQAPPKMFAFDAAFPHDASQAEVCAGTVAEVIQSVVNGADGCVFCFGHSKLGKSYTMIGGDESMQTLGIIPCAISWLFKLINERKEKTGARFSVRVSAVEVWGKEENLKDLLSEVATGSLQDGQSPGVYLCEDPICGMQLQNQSELRAPTPEKAAFFLDAAIAARYSSRADADPEEHLNSHMLFTLHIYQYRMEKTGKGGMSGGRSRLHLIDLGSCMKVLGGEKGRDSSSTAAGLCLSLSALGNVILALVNGSKHIPYKDSKLTMLLRESLGNMNCRTTMIAHISSSPSNFSDTLSTIQIASRVLRMKKKKTKVSMQYTSSSSGGESSCEEGRMRRPTHLRPFHSRSSADSNLPLLHLSSDPDDYSSSEQSCDTVIYMGPNGGAISDRELTDNEGPPEFVPIIPALLKSKAESGILPTTPTLQQQQQQTVLSQPQPQPAPTQTHTQPSALPTQSLTTLTQPPLPLLQPLGQPLPPVPEEGAECLKCNTFAELQERLECIDGSEEVAKFPFEEELVNRGSKSDTLVPPGSETGPKGGMEVGVELEVEVSRRLSNDQQLQEIREVVEEAELAQTMIESLSLTGSRSVTGSSGAGHTNTNPLQRAKSASLHDSRESLSAGSSSDGKPRPLGSPRLGIASLTKTSDYRPPSSPSQRCKVYTQKGVMPGTPPLSCQSLSTADSLAADSGRSSTESLLQLESLSRTSPMRMSPQILKRTYSSSASLGSAETLCDDNVPQIPLDGRRDVPAPGLAPSPSSTPAPAAPRSLGEDELVFTLGCEEGLEVRGLLESGGRPTSIISFTSDCSVTALASGSRPVSIISSISEDLDCYGNNTTVIATTTELVTMTSASVAGVIAMAEVSMAKLRMEREAMAALPSRRSSISSWLSELSAGSDGDQSLHSFSQSHGHGEALAEPDPTQVPLSGAEEQDEVSLGSGGRKTPDSEVVFCGDEKGTENEKSTLNKERLKRMPPSLGKTTITLSNIQTLGASSNFIPFKTKITAHPCVAVKPMVIQEPTILSSPTKTHLLSKDPAKPAPALVLAAMSSELSFDDPWMKRDGGDVRPKELVCEVKPEKRVVEQPVKTDPAKTQAWPQGDRASRVDSGYGGDRCSSSSGETVSSPDSCKRVVDGCEMVLVSSGECLMTPIYSADILHTASLPRGWHRINRHDGLDEDSLRFDANGRGARGEYQGLGVTTSTPCSPRATLDRRGLSGRQGLFSRQKGIPPLPPVRKSSLDQKNRAGGPLSPLHAPSHGLSFLGSTPEDLGGLGGGGGKQKGYNVESSRLFNAKLEQLANRTNSLGRSHGGHSSHGPHYDCLSLERGESLSSLGCKGAAGGGRGDCNMPRTGRSVIRGGSVSSSSSNGNGSGNSPGSVPQSPKSSQSKISAVSKLLMASPKTRSMSASSTKTLSFSTKSLPQSVNRSSSLPPNGKTQPQPQPQPQGQTSSQALGQNKEPSSGSWSTQSLSRSRGGGLAVKLPPRAVNGRISELLQGNGGSRSTGHNRGGGSEAGEERGAGGGGGGGGGGGAQGEERPVVVHTLPSPYSKITAPRRPHRCSSGHASDNSSVLSGELPPAMGKTALFYHSGASSGYESMLRDSEATGSTSSAQDSLSEHSSATSSSRRSLKNNKKRNNNTGLLLMLLPSTQRRRLIPSLTLESSSPIRKPAISSSVRWVDGPLSPAPRGTTEPFEIKVYKIDDVERLQRRREKGNKEVVYFSAKLKTLEHRQHRISEIRAKYDWLKKELEQTKQHLMLEPEKWTTEFDLQQTFEVDSLEYLEALEVVTDRLETRVNFCKAHLMMVTCFDVTCCRR